MTMDKQAQAASPARRAFLKAAGLGAGAAAAGVVGTTAMGVQPATATQGPEADGYRETAHVKRFYDLAKNF
jgi:hypothetical protein